MRKNIRFGKKIEKMNRKEKIKRVERRIEGVELEGGLKE